MNGIVPYISGHAIKRYEGNFSRFNYVPHKHQKEFNESTSPITLGCAGARSGKSRAAFAKEAAAARIQPGYWKSDSESGDPYGILICEPTGKQVRQVAWHQIIRMIPPSRIITVNRTDRIIYVRGIHGITEIVFSSYKQGPEKIEGMKFYRTLLDEVFQCPKPFYDEVVTRLSDREGDLVMVGTPKPSDWIEDEIISKADGKLISFFEWTTADNPYFPKRQLDRMRKLLPLKIFERNFLARRDVFVGQIFDEFDKFWHVQDFDNSPEACKKRYKIILAGVDWGFTHNGVIVLVGIDHDDNVDVILEIAEPGIHAVSDDPMDRTWATIAKSLQEKYDIEMFYCGHDRPEHIQRFNENDIPAMSWLEACSGRGYNAVEKSLVKSRISFVQTLMKKDPENKLKFRIHPSCENLIKNLRMQKWKEDSKGNQSEEPEKKHDDSNDALGMALFSGQDWFKIDLRSIFIRAEPTEF